MKTNLLKLATAALMPVALLMFTSCSSTPEGTATEKSITEPGVPGGVFVKTYETTATVSALDVATRKVTLTSEGGTKNTFTAPTEMVNFDQLRVGDRIKAIVTGRAVVFMASDAAPQVEGAATLVALTPEGSKPGVLAADTVQVKATVTDINLKKHKATLLFPEGNSETFEVRKDVDLTQRKVGEQVVIRVTQAVLIGVQKP